jgi:hypothetical protein
LPNKTFKILNFFLPIAIDLSNWQFSTSGHTTITFGRVVDKIGMGVLTIFMDGTTTTIFEEANTLR